MDETEQNSAAQTEENSQEGTTQNEQTISMSAYKKLQRDLQKSQDTVKSFEAKQREGESVEQALERERQRADGLERELQVASVKASAPAELHDIIDSFVSKHGFVPDAEDMELLASKVTRSEPSNQETTTTQSSGVRNSPASRKPVDRTTDAYLQSVTLDQIKG